MNEVESNRPPSADVVGVIEIASVAGIVVFWLESGVAQSTGFQSKELLVSLNYVEGLRKRRALGEPITHVSICTELPDSVGQAGVSDKLPDNYDWTKQDRARVARRRR